MKLKIPDEKLDELATDWCIEKGVYNKEHFAFQAAFRASEQTHQAIVDKLIEIIGMQTKVLCENTCYDSCGFEPTQESHKTLVDCFINNDFVARKCLDDTDKMMKELNQTGEK